MTLDLVVLGALVLAAVLGAASGALRQAAQLLAVVAGWLAARRLGPAVARGFGRALPLEAARPAAAVLLFVGAATLAALVLHALLAAGGLARAVKSPADRAAGALLGGAKAALVAWVLLSALVLAGGPVGVGRARVDPAGSDLADVARAHNLLVRIDPAAARTLERILRAARDPRSAARLERDPDARRLLEDPRVRELARRRAAAPAGGEDEAFPEAERLLERDPALRALVERLRARGDVPGDR